MSNYSSQLQSNNEVLTSNNLDLQSLIDQANALPDASGVELPQLSNEGSASDMLSGKQLINQNGDIVTGNIPIVEQATPSIKLHPPSATITVTSVQEKGYVSSGTKTSTLELETQGNIEVLPTKSFQIVVPEGVYTTGTVTVLPIPDNYVDTSDATASANKIMNGESAYINGEKITGTFSLDTELSTQDDLIAQIQAAVDSLPEADSSGGSSFEICTVQVQPDESSTPSISVIDYTDVEFNSKTFEGLGSFSVPKNTIIFIRGWSINSSASGATELIYMYGHAVYRITDNAVFTIKE